MGMLLYMMEQQNKENKNNKAVGVAKQATPKPVTKKEPEKKVVQETKKPEIKKPSRVEIMRMNVATVREYAESQGIENANTMSGAELKRILVNKMFEEE